MGEIRKLIIDIDEDSPYYESVGTASLIDLLGEHKIKVIDME